MAFILSLSFPIITPFQSPIQNRKSCEYQWKLLLILSAESCNNFSYFCVFKLFQLPEEARFSLHTAALPSLPPGTPPSCDPSPSWFRPPQGSHCWTLLQHWEYKAPQQGANCSDHHIFTFSCSVQRSETLFFPKAVVKCLMLHVWYVERWKVMKFTMKALSKIWFGDKVWWQWCGWKWK